MYFILTYQLLESFIRVVSVSRVLFINVPNDKTLEE